MKYFLLIGLWPAIAFSLPCPGGGGILYKGDTIAAVIQQCGEPQSKQTINKTTSSTKEWAYYKPHAYDQGSTQMVVIFNNDRVSNIRITERYPYYLCQQGIVQISSVFITTQLSCGDWVTYLTWTSFCGWTFQIGDNIQYVASICGQPASQSTVQLQSVEETRFFYGGDDPQTIIFQNGRLVDWQ